DDEGVEAGRGEVAGHAVGDDAVVLDDEDFGHVLTIDPCPCRASCRNGNDLVNEGDGFRGGEEDGRAVRPTPVSEPSMSFDELRTGFTAAVSHELRTPLARILALLDSADLPGADVRALLDQARAEVENAGTLIDEILFLAELESGREVVALGHTTALPVIREVLDEHE